MFRRESGKIIKNHLGDSEVSSAKPTFLSEEKEFSRKFFVSLKLSS
jgi:hypothetical protein